MMTPNCFIDAFTKFPEKYREKEITFNINPYKHELSFTVSENDDPNSENRFGIILYEDDTYYVGQIKWKKDDSTKIN